MQCAICLQEPESPFQQPCCSNFFCLGCIQKWKKVKSTCPLCGVKLGNDDVNQLKYSQDQNNFDNGFLMLETEMKEIAARIKFVQNRIITCRIQSKNMKSSISGSHIMFLNDQLELIRQYFQSMQEYWMLQDRSNCVQYIQMLVELLSTVEDALNNGAVRQDYYEMEYEKGDYYDMADCYDPEQFDDDEYYMYEQYQVANMKKQAYKSKKVSKTNASNQQKNKIIKEV